jgi:adenosylmethionine-8-amino-7-oxononanoate aminotransferase
LGYGRLELGKALADQANQIPFVHGMRFSNPAAKELADRLSTFAPQSINWFFFTSGGSEAVESALKIARQYFLQIGKPEKSRFIGRWQSFHGNTLATQSIGGHVGRRKPHLPLLKDWPHIPPVYCYRCPYSLKYPECGILCAHALEKEILWQGAETIAGFIAEPIVGAAGGAIVPPPEYFPIIRQICDKYDVLFIADEVFTGFGRTGKNFAIDHWGIIPDMITSAKGISSGYAPLGCLMVTDAVMSAFQKGSGSVDHNFTYAGNPLACHVGSEVMKIIVAERLVQKAAERGEQLLAGLKSLEHYPSIGDIRGRGLMMGIELVKNKKTKEPFSLGFHAHQKINQIALEEGLIIYPSSGTVDGTNGDHFLLVPPLIITEAEVKILITLLDRVFERFESLPRD